MKTNPNDNVQTVSVGPSDAIVDGLTKREYFAGIALQAIIQTYEQPSSAHLDNLAKGAVNLADALIRALNN